MGGAAADFKHEKLHVLWVHNTARDGRMFLWDVLDAMPAEIEVDELVLPLRPQIRMISTLIAKVRRAAASADVVHSQFGSLVGLVASFSRKPFVLSLRGTDFYVLPSRTLAGRVEARARQVFTFIACLRADLIVVMSERMRHELRRWPLLRKKPIVVIVDPVGDEFLMLKPVSQEHFGHSQPFVVFVGSIAKDNPVKQTWLVQDAVSLGRRVGLPINLQLVSGMPRESVRQTMAKSDLIALTSTHEGWPNVIKEGLALGIPFVATDVSDLAAFCGPSQPNQIIEANSLDVALALINAFVARELRGPFAQFTSTAVAIKHKALYLHLVHKK